MNAENRTSSWIFQKFSFVQTLFCDHHMMKANKKISAKSVE